MPNYYTIYCDESDARGRFYSHFYAGALLLSEHRQRIEEELQGTKRSLNLGRELKWQRISASYEGKYRTFIERYFDFIRAGEIKVRVMFTQNIFEAVGLDEEQIDNAYWLLYYQFIKSAFGLRYSNEVYDDTVFVSLLLDQVPGSQAQFEQFKRYMSSLSDYPTFSRQRVVIRKDDIGEVDSKDHAILQGLDIILGAMQFRLNDRHLDKEEGARRRGKRTLAKERLYKFINQQIQTMYRNFNIGISTGQPTGFRDKWNHPYRHWRFIPKDAEVDTSKGKKKTRER